MKEWDKVGCRLASGKTNMAMAMEIYLFSNRTFVSSNGGFSMATLVLPECVLWEGTV